MGHYVQGFIAKKDLLRAATAQYRNAVVVDLSQNFGLLLNTDEFFDELSMPPYLDGSQEDTDSIWKFSPQLEDFAIRLSAVTPVVYIETDYVGGPGIQAALALNLGKVIYGPQQSSAAISRDSPINGALRSIGVKYDPEQLDEFDTLGLGRHRCNEDWILQPNFGPSIGKGYHPSGILAKIMRWINFNRRSY